mgnify:CR=1 FL=1
MNITEPQGYKSRSALSGLRFSDFIAQRLYALFAVSQAGLSELAAPDVWLEGFDNIFKNQVNQEGK